MRSCACGCGEKLVNRRSDARYATDACRVRAWKRATGYADPRRPKTVRNASRARRHPDLRISYLKAVRAVDALESPIDHIGPYRMVTVGQVREALESCLTERQRASLREAA